MPRLDFHLTRASDGAAVTGESYRGKVVVALFRLHQLPGCLPGHPGQSGRHAGQGEQQGCADPVRDGRSQPRHAGGAERTMSTPSRPSSRACAAATTNWPTWRGAIASPIRWTKAALHGDAFQCGVLLRSRRPRPAGHHRHHRYRRAWPKMCEAAEVISLRCAAPSHPPPAPLRASSRTGSDAGRWCAPVPGRSVRRSWR